MICERGTALTFLAGVVAGGLTALLLAPDSGSETRRKVRDGARDLKDEVGTKAHDLAHATQSRIDHLTEAARTKVASVRGAVEGSES